MCGAITVQTEEFVWNHVAGDAENMTILEIPQCFWGVAGSLRKVVMTSTQPGGIVLRANSLASNSNPLMGFSSSIEVLSLKSVRLLDPVSNNGANGVFITDLRTVIFGYLQLKDLEITGAQISSVFPNYLGSHNALRRLVLADNQLEGGFTPQFPFSLEIIDVSNNLLTGALPGALPRKAQYFSVANNAFIGPIPPTILMSLQSLAPSINLSGNRLSGPIPAALFMPLQPGLQSSLVFDASRNNLSGNIPFNLLLDPQAIGSLGKLQLDFSNNFIEGPIQGLFSRVFMTHTISINFAHNLLSGGPPNLISMAGLVNTFNVNFAFNQLSGSIPPFFPVTPQIGSLTEIRFNFSSNHFTELPTHLLPSSTQIPTLRSAFLHLDSNMISGTIPSTLLARPDTFDQLHVDLSNNSLSGSLPSDLFENTGVSTSVMEVYLNLASNMLTGPLTPFTALPAVEDLRLDLSSNNLAASIPAGYFESLLNGRQRTVHLNLSKCDLTGALSLPTFMFNASLHLNLRNNSLESLDVASEVAYLKALDVGENYEMTGIIPSEFFQNSSQLSIFIANHTKISGDFPSISNTLTSSLTVLDLSFSDIEFCGQNRRAWKKPDLITCVLSNTTVSYCSQFYPAQCEFGEIAPISAPISAPTSEPSTETPIPSSTPTGDTPSSSGPTDAPSATGNPSTPSESPSSSEPSATPSMIPSTPNTDPAAPVEAPSQPPTPTSAASETHVGSIIVVLSVILSLSL